MTRKLPPEALQASTAQQRWVDDAVRDIFRDAPAWQPIAAMAALYRLRPGLGVEADPVAHQMHMWKFPRDDLYFARVCRLLKMYGIGSHYGAD